MSYKQLIEGQRYQIEAYLREGFIYREIGKRLRVSHSTISREVGRNRIRDSHYLPEVAQAKAVKRRCQASKFKISELTITFVEFGLNEKWSPEQKMPDRENASATDNLLRYLMNYARRHNLASGALRS